MSQEMDETRDHITKEQHDALQRRTEREKKEAQDRDAEHVAALEQAWQEAKQWECNAKVFERQHADASETADALRQHVVGLLRRTQQ